MILHFVSTISILAALRNVDAIADGPNTEAFDPIVDWSCTADEIVVSARDGRFAGKLAAVGHPKCSSLPIVSGVSSSSSSLRAGTLRMSLGHPERCGIQYDETTSSWWVLVSVQAHPVLVVDGDRTVNVTCDSLERAANATEDARESAALIISEPLRDAVTDAPLDLNVEFRLVKEEEVVEEAIYGHSYSLLLSSPSSIRVGDCTAESGSGRERVRLLSGGCPLTPPLITPFTQQHGSLRASIPSMFRFPHSDSVLFECEVLPCQGDKCVPSCDTTDEAVRTLLGVGPTEQPMGAQRVRVEIHLTERRRREEEKSVEQPLVDFKGQEQVKEEEGREQLPMEQDQNDSPAQEKPCADRARQVEEMYLVCVGLSILFAAGCCCNILFCCFLRRGQGNRSSKSIDSESARTGSTTTTTTSGGPDFWISDIDKDVHSVPAFFDNCRTSVASFQTGNANRRSFRPSPVYSAPHVPRTWMVASEMSDYGSDSQYGRGEMRSEYGRPSDYGVSNSTFLSLSAETDVDSEHSHPQPDNHAISYH